MDTIWRPDLTQDGGPKYLALARALREAIRVGELPEGAQLPTVRDLGWRLSVTPGTVSRAYQIATQEGLLQATVGRGTFVAARTPQLGPKVPIYIERNVRTIAGRIDLRSPSLPDMGQAQALPRRCVGFPCKTQRIGWIIPVRSRNSRCARRCAIGWTSGSWGRSGRRTSC